MKSAHTLPRKRGDSLARRSPLRCSARRRALLCGVVAAACAACFIGCATWDQPLIPRSGWSKRWGPLVPHEKFPGDCSICHQPGGWRTLREDFTFDHEKETGYRLEGAHLEAACLRCHNDRGPVKQYVRRGCGGCHPDPHKSSQSIDCTRCHNQTDWQATGLVLEHARTRFPLVAAHAITPCDACHTRASVGDYRNTPVDCHLCHQQDAGRAFPNHPINGWIRNCERCHTPASWRAEGLNHSQFPLEGGHANVDCIQCHVGGLVRQTPTACFFCHQNDYINAPNHVLNGYSTDCTLCHTINAWR